MDDVDFVCISAFKKPVPVPMGWVFLIISPFLSFVNIYYISALFLIFFCAFCIILLVRNTRM